MAIGNTNLLHTLPSTSSVAISNTKVNYIVEELVSY